MSLEAAQALCANIARGLAVNEEGREAFLAGLRLQMGQPGMVRFQPPCQCRNERHCPAQVLVPKCLKCSAHAVQALVSGWGHLFQGICACSHLMLHNAAVQMKRLLQPLHSEAGSEQDGQPQQIPQQRCLLDMLAEVAPLREGLMRALLDRMVSCAQGGSDDAAEPFSSDLGSSFEQHASAADAAACVGGALAPLQHHQKQQQASGAA